jgi:hypothetical protein
LKLYKFMSCWTVALLVATAAEANAQKMQWTDVVYTPGRWQAGKIVAPSGTDTLALVMRVDYFAQPPRWRAEVRRTIDGVSFGEPVVLLGEKTRLFVATALGATPLANHALGKDALIGSAVMRFDAQGMRIGPANGVVRDATRIAFRRTAKTPTFDEAALDPGKATANRKIISQGLAAVGNQRSASVVATAGARGVDRVKTAKGEISVTPDALAVSRMEETSVNALRLEEFMRTGNLGLYKQSAQ